MAIGEYRSWSLRATQPSVIAWRLALPSLPDDREPEPVLDDPAYIAELRRLPLQLHAEVECKVVPTRFPITPTPGVEPFVALVFLMAERTGNNVKGESFLEGDFEASLEAGAERWVTLFLGYIRQYGKPRAVYVNERGAYRLLHTICRQIDLNLVYNELAELESTAYGAKRSILLSDI